MKLKLDDAGHVALQDGHPVYIHDDGKEIAFDAQASLASIARLTRELKDAKTQVEANATRLKNFDGIEDPDKAREALATVESLRQKKLVDAGELDAVKAEISKVFEGKLTEAEARAKTLEQQLVDEKIGGSFERSPFIAKKLAIPPDIARAFFGAAFRLEDGRTVAYDASGEKIYSRVRPGDLADFDEAMEVLVERYPRRDDILKGSGASGLNTTLAQAGKPGAKTLSRSAFDALTPKDRAGFVRDGGTVTA
ncbi:DUF6651 domain-containing protein [Castellaniella defragrans]|uniref:DUF6651 domain-containing protein n=1 Tax=Castellaniella defragrans TaxID=75697 RepID=UPI0005BB6A41|nr:DUF6651 domain-containing protein [Castellaniella defragrans]